METGALCVQRQASKRDQITPLLILCVAEDPLNIMAMKVQGHNAVSVEGKSCCTVPSIADAQITLVFSAVIAEVLQIRRLLLCTSFLVNAGRVTSPSDTNILQDNGNGTSTTCTKTPYYNGCSTYPVSFDPAA